MKAGLTVFIVAGIVAIGIDSYQAYLKAVVPYVASNTNNPKAPPVRSETPRDYVNQKCAENRQPLPESMVVELSSGCYAGPYVLPKSWRTYNVTRTFHESNWVSVWCNGQDRPSPIRSHNEDFAGDFRVCDEFYAQGEGSIRFKPTTYRLGSLQFSLGDAQYCDKPDDALYDEVHLYAHPRFLFDVHNNGFSNSSTPINWANGFKGLVPVCFLVDDKGMPTKVHLLQPVGDKEFEDHLKAVVEGWRYQPAMNDGQLVKIQMLATFHID